MNLLGKEKTYAKTPIQIEGLENVTITTYSCGPSHIVAIARDNKIYAWGDGSYGKLGKNLQRFCIKIFSF